MMDETKATRDFMFMAAGSLRELSVNVHRSKTRSTSVSTFTDAPIFLQGFFNANVTFCLLNLIRNSRILNMGKLDIYWEVTDESGSPPFATRTASRILHIFEQS